MATNENEHASSANHYDDDQKSLKSDASHQSAENPQQPASKQLDDGRYVLQDNDAWEVLGYSFPKWRKWQILCVVFAIQISINLNASIYSHGVSAIAEEYHVSSEYCPQDIHTRII